MLPCADLRKKQARAHLTASVRPARVDSSEQIDARNEALPYNTMWQSMVVYNCKNPYASKKVHWSSERLRLYWIVGLIHCLCRGPTLFVVLVLLFDLTKKQTQIAKLHRNILVVDLLKFYQLENLYSNKSLIIVSTRLQPAIVALPFFCRCSKIVSIKSIDLLVYGKKLTIDVIQDASKNYYRKQTQHSPTIPFPLLLEIQKNICKAVWKQLQVDHLQASFKSQETLASPCLTLIVFGLETIRDEMVLTLFSGQDGPSCCLVKEMSRSYFVWFKGLKKMGQSGGNIPYSFPLCSFSLSRIQHIPA